jgi:hypothetical protein
VPGPAAGLRLEDAAQAQHVRDAVIGDEGEHADLQRWGDP